MSAAERGLPLRLVGGVAVAVRCPSAARSPLRREYADVDLVTLGRARDGVIELMAELGYAGDREFNTLHGHRRLYFWDRGNERQVDVFVDEAKLCHTIDFRPRVELEATTLPLADLLLMKLQVVETNEKDLLDVCALLTDHDLGTGQDAVDSTYIAALASSDWGLWRTLVMVAERGEEFALRLADFGAGDRVATRLRQLRQELEAAPKSRGWRMRARVGDRKRWYELPEEAH
ncbi:MAG TPA: hypothetical protein VFJ57_15620 [Solirubrobacterales bacterium]|nr:hypothetical protein [Solirubrobacterales bacterium]